MQYKGDFCIDKRAGAWFARNYDLNQPGKIPELSLKQIEDIATHLINFFIPKSWAIILDYRCNYKCPMCPFQGQGYSGDYWVERTSQKRIVSKEEAFAIIDKLAYNNVKRVTLTSPGELFLYPYWEEVSKYAVSKGLIVSTITNGSMIDAEMCERMKAVGITEVSVSLDALSQDIYEKVRSSNKKHYEAAVNAPLLLKKTGFRVNTHFVRQTENLKEKDEFIKYWTKKQGLILFQLDTRQNIMTGFPSIKLVLKRKSLFMVFVLGMVISLF